MRSLLSYRVARRTAIAACCLTALLVGAPACAPKSETPAEPTAARSTRFVETDNWWSIEIPNDWQAIRIELDGDRTAIDNWPTSPGDDPKPLRDLHSTGISYEFHEGAACQQCSVADRARVTVAAQPAAGLGTLHREIAAALQAAPGVQDFTMRTFTCDGGECVAMAHIAQGIRIDTELRPAPGQQRVYQLRTAVPVQRFDGVRPVFEHAMASFRTEPRS